MPLLLTDNEVSQLMTMGDAIEVIEDSFRQAGEGLTWNRPRSRIRMPAGFHHLMAAAVLGSNVFGLKTYTSFRSGVRFLVILYDSNSGDLLAMVQGGKLTQLRTGAVSAVATKYMAREDSTTVGIVGTGFQGRAQLEGVCGVRSIKSVKAFDAVEDSAKRFAGEMSKELGVEITAVASAEEAVKDVDIVITMTTSRTPVLLGDWLQPGQHINAAGSNHWIRQEVDDNVIRKASIIIVDSLEDAQVEAGDLLYPIERGRVRWSQIKELADVVVGHIKARKSQDDITLFESQGIAVSDIAAAAYVYAKAKERGLGVELPMST
ncbi:MAG: ornithine cyclodeaminase family protein [Chloroflexi bacterium]|nr:ornithine cyclodeaminase family protein [Chloroflexota bacterium]